MSPPQFPRGVPVSDPRRTDLARADAWLRATLKLQQLARRRPFLADLLVSGIERAVDDLLGADDQPEDGASAGRRLP